MANAERLLEDSTKVSSPTQTALAELSLEEVAKAWMLYLTALQKRGKKDWLPPGQFPRMKGKSRDLRRVGKFLEEHQSYLEHLPVDQAFYRHEVKLEFLKFLLEYLRLLAPIAQTSRKQIIEWLSVANPGFNIGTIVSKRRPQAFDQILRRLNLWQLVTLNELKERGFYVNATRSGHLTAPDSHGTTFSVLVGSLALLLVVMLRGEIQLLLVDGNPSEPSLVRTSVRGTPMRTR
ncbi:MAG: hypothetical protein JRN54_06140 [Nitrososphaerota archaeon]|jgi:hypothetical protein|nr:hypothetical protein [Nitrososphaerota archaeon]